MSLVHFKNINGVAFDNIHFSVYSYTENTSSRNIIL